MKRQYRLGVFGAALCLVVLALVRFGVAAGGTEGATLVVSGAVEHPLKLTPADLAKMPRTSAQVTEHGRQATYEGVLLTEILKAAGVPMGDMLHTMAGGAPMGKMSHPMAAGAPMGEMAHAHGLTIYVLAKAADGYQVLFALPELDPAFIDQTVLVADRLDGKPLPRELGPYRIIAPKEKRGGRWLKMLEEIHVARLEPSK